MIKTAKNQSDKPKVAVALSGGVDSSVAALLLKRAGYDLIGIFMNNWESDPDNPECPAGQDLDDAKAVADHLKIPFQAISFRRSYWNHVFQHCLDEFATGRTPNPDVLCNKYIKFKELLDHAHALGADYLATGHYAEIAYRDNHYQLLKSKDSNKDQTYFLYLLNQYQLSKTLFPIGQYLKPEIRALAKETGLMTHAKKDSTGICFIGERKFKTFLKEFLLAQPGNIETVDGSILGQHDGIMFYTVGQRKGLYIGGQKNQMESPWYVLEKDIKRNVLVVGQGFDHPRLYANGLICSDMHWIGSVPDTFPFTCTAKTRYRQSEQNCRISPWGEEQYQVTFDEPQRAITPGQSIVFYRDKQCLGGGIIEASQG